MMKTKYLFGIEPVELENKFYLEALKYKLEAGKKLYRELHIKDKPTKKELDRMFYVVRAISFTEELILEVEEYA